MWPSWLRSKNPATGFRGSLVGPIRAEARSASSKRERISLCPSKIGQSVGIRRAHGHGGMYLFIDSGPARMDPKDDELVTAWGLLLEATSRTGRLLADEIEGAVGLPVTWVEVLFRLRRTRDNLL